MSVFERYQVFYTAEQHLFDPACPVYVHRTQLTLDRESGAVLLQARMVNMGDRTLRGVYLRVTCLDQKEQVLTVMHYVPVTDLDAPKSAVFGDDRVLTIQERATRAVRVYVQRAVYDDGSVWNEAEQPDYTRLPAPIAVQPTDPDYGYLTQTSRAAGVKNDVRYQALSCGWYCTCGLPNGNWRQNCGYCGADREWLFTHMKAPKEEPAPKPQPEPEPEPEPELPAPLIADAPAPAPTPLFFAPLAPMQPVPEPPTQAEAEKEFPVIPAEDPPKKKKSRVGLIIAIALLSLGVLAALGYCAYRFGRPMLQYREAENLLAQSQYAEARAAFEDLGDYKDSAARIQETWYLEARQKMSEGDYAGAYDLFTTLSGYGEADSLAADCLCSLGILAFNDADYEKAWDYAQQLHAAYPSYEGANDLTVQTAYQLGLAAMEREDYQAAKDWFAQSNGYGDSADRITRCDYEAACDLLEAGDYPAAVEALLALGDYADSTRLALDAMYAYLTAAGADADPEIMRNYMTALLREDYPGAQDLYDWKVTLKVNESDTDASTGVGITTDLNKLRIHYSIAGGLTRDPMSVVMIYTLPDKATGSVQLVTGGTDGAQGVLDWSKLGIPACTKGGNVTLKFCDGATGDEIYTCTLELKIETPETTEQS